MKLAAAVRNGGDSLWGRQVERQAGAGRDRRRQTEAGGGRQRQVETDRRVEADKGANRARCVMWVSWGSDRCRADVWVEIIFKYSIKECLNIACCFML